MKYFRKIFPFLVIIVLILIVKNNIEAIIDIKNNSITAGHLENELRIEEKEQKYLQEQLKYVNSDKFIEEQAKGKLGLLKPGEFFVIAPTSTPLNNRPVISVEYPNWKKWLELFF